MTEVTLAQKIALLRSLYNEAGDETRPIIASMISDYHRRVGNSISDDGYLPYA